MLKCSAVLVAEYLRQILQMMTQIEERPDTPVSIEEKGEDGKPKRWQDYLKIATFPTELLSHTPSGGTPGLEVMEGGEVPGRSPGIKTEERGFLPTASTTAASPTVSATSENATISKLVADESPSILANEDAEPVKLLLKQLGEVHDSLQREKTVKWNDFLRKVRAERRRDGEAAAAALASDIGAQRLMPIMPEVSLTDGEIIGVAGLGNKGKVGRAKWNEFKLLVLSGIPVAYRAKIWAECSGATTLRIPGYYDDLIARKESEDDPAIVAQIQMDINRTLTDNIFFRKGSGVQKLNEVLVAYSRRNAEVGYCQGMNLITACLLLIMPTAEDAFWILTSIIENILPQGYYDHSLLASRADQQVLRHMSLRYCRNFLPISMSSALSWKPSLFSGSSVSSLIVYPPRHSFAFGTLFSAQMMEARFFSRSRLLCSNSMSSNYFNVLRQPAFIRTSTIK